MDVHGVGAQLTINEPVVADKHGWSIAQLLIGDPHVGAIEFGWLVQSGVSHPHLFLVVRKPKEYHFITKTTKTGEYGFTAIKGAVKPDADIGKDLNTSQLFHIGYYPPDHSWWIQYKGAWVGHIDANYWAPSLKAAQVLQWYGEVGSYGSKYPCTQMGTGHLGTDATAPRARIGDMFYEVFDKSGESIDVAAKAQMLPYDGPPANSLVWNSDTPQGAGAGISSFYYGGPGFCAR